MAAKPTKEQNDKVDVPESAKTNGEKNGTTVREPQVAEPETRSFDERTSAQAPWLRKDGSQDNGARDLTAPEGARAAQSREGDKTTVEETDKAIKDGVIEGRKQVVPGDDKDLEPAKNPVK